VSWIGNGPSASGQIISDGTPGPKSKVLQGIATILQDGAGTTAQLNFIDGIQTLAQVSRVFQLQSVTAPATINGVANQSQYLTGSAASSIPVGTSVVFAGFTNSANNTTKTVTAVGPNFIQVTNSSAVAETNYSGTATFTQGVAVAGVTVLPCASSTDTETGSPTIKVNSGSGNNAKVAITLSGTGTSGSTTSVLVTVYLAS
jgi:hypothetical protein